VKTKSCLSYFGSDSEVAELLASRLSHCKHVTIPFVGGASILPHLKSRAIVANDLNSHAINFYRVVSGFHGLQKKKQLIELCKSTLSHPDEIEAAEYYLKQDASVMHEHRAWAYWALCWVGRKGKGGTKHLGGSPSVRRTPIGGTNATRIDAAANDLDEWAKQFKRCEWEQIDFRQLLPKVADNAQCGIYLDAPWPKSGRNYLHPFIEKDHRELAESLERFEYAAVLLRYEDCDLIRELYPESSWTWERRGTRTQSNDLVDEAWISRRASL